MGLKVSTQYTATTKPGVCHHFRECGINSLVARTPVSGAWSKEKKYSLSESINKTCLLVSFFSFFFYSPPLSFHQLLRCVHLYEDHRGKKDE